MFAAIASSYKTSAYCLTHAEPADHTVLRPALPELKPVGIDGGRGRFTTLTGRSGRRYMFCLIAREQAALYGDCIFAISSSCRRSADRVASRLPEDLCTTERVFVHLPDGSSVNAILSDLTAGD